MLVIHRRQAWPNLAGPSCIVSPEKRRKWMTKFSTHPIPSSSLKQRIGSGQSWWVKKNQDWYKMCGFFFNVFGPPPDSWICLVFIGIGGFSPDWLHPTDSHAQVLVVLLHPGFLHSDSVLDLIPTPNYLLENVIFFCVCLCVFMAKRILFFFIYLRSHHKLNVLYKYVDEREREVTAFISIVMQTPLLCIFQLKDKQLPNPFLKLRHQQE